jgi:DNA polymerase
MADLEQLRRQAAGCRNCGLWEHATQTVFGEGDPDAAVMLVGEQPGDQEDVRGRPFVGPAGNLLDRALQQAGIDRDSVYITNAVKHFKWEPKGKRRIHKRPSAVEISACRAWLDGELDAVQPRVVVAMGATAAQALLGPQFRVTRDHGRPIETTQGFEIVATTHPSSVLRAPDEQARELGYAQLVDDLSVVAGILSADGS